MANVNVNQQEAKNILDLATDVESIQDTMRVIIEMISDTVTMYGLNTREEVLRAEERIIVLSNSAQAQLKDLEALTTKIKEACNA